MADVANFSLAPPLRCGELLGNSPRTWCGAPASHFRPRVSEFPDGYFCASHARPGDQPIADSFLFRRVSVQLEVLLAGVTWQPGDADHEAVELLNRVIERAGGLVNLRTVTSAVGRYSPPAPQTRGPKPRGVR